MNSYNHTERNTTAICTSCGKGLCNECISSKAGLCMMCYHAYLRGKVINAIKYLILLAIIGVIGYLWDPMGKEGMPQSGVSSYILMATCTGIFLISGRLRLPSITFVGSGANDVGIMMLLMMIIKFIIAVFLGTLLLPAIIIWQLSVIVLNIVRLRKK